jgi:four helix bundle protein
MASYKRFEDLPVWNKAADLAAYVFDWTTRPEFRGKGDLANQMQRATLSISNNVAEGFQRGSTAELIHYLYIARGDGTNARI